ncbi:MAG TPA: HAMP domain-containing protein [Bdellovibrio sp.]|nr:HAMP domain-containing protein [Bdellovibrio sp.]
MADKRRKITGMITNNKQFTYGLTNVFIALFIILIINTVYLYKFSQVPDICSEAGGIINPTGIVNHMNFMIFGSVLAVVLAGGLCFVFALSLTHRFFGPMVPISRHLEELKKGNFQSRIKLRDKDELYDLSQQLNQLTEEFEKNYVRR